MPAKRLLRRHRDNRQRLPYRQAPRRQMRLGSARARRGGSSRGTSEHTPPSDVRAFIAAKRRTRGSTLDPVEDRGGADTNNMQSSAYNGLWPPQCWSPPATQPRRRVRRRRKSQTPQVAPPAADVAAALAARYDTSQDFRIVPRTYEGGVLQRKATESGTVYVKKPEKCGGPTLPRDEAVPLGRRTMFLYFPADKQVMKE